MILTPYCPRCDTLPVVVLDDGHQCFCGNDDCPVLAWDSHLSREELLANPVAIDDPGAGYGE